jgi:hypothetical protein
MSNFVKNYQTRLIHAVYGYSRENGLSVVRDDRPDVCFFEFECGDFSWSLPDEIHEYNADVEEKLTLVEKFLEEKKLTNYIIPFCIP